MFFTVNDIRGNTGAFATLAKIAVNAPEK